MKNLFVLAIILLLGIVICLPVWGQTTDDSAPQQAMSNTRSGSFYVKPYVGTSFGKTEYVMNLAFEVDDDTTYILGSRLEFPLDVMMVGGLIGYGTDPSSEGAWRIEAGAYTSITDPSGLMRDYDWANIGFFGEWLGEVRDISFTESDAEMKSSMFSVEASRRIIVGSVADVWLVGGFRYHRIEQDIIGYTGWQYDPYGDSLVFGSMQDTAALFYQVTYKLPHLGLRAAMTPYRSLSVDVRTSFTRAFVSDFDDHLLREKSATATTTGLGVLAGLDLNLDLQPDREQGLQFGLSGEFTYVKSSGTQTQVYYGEASEGEPIPRSLGIPHDINMTQFRIGVSLGYRF